MIVQNDCGACDLAKELLKEPINKKELIILDVNSEKGLELAEKYKIESIPIIINENDKFQQKCYLSKDGAKMYCDDGTEKELIKKSE
jgi:hypothetical protein